MAGLFRDIFLFLLMAILGFSVFAVFFHVLVAINAIPDLDDQAMLIFRDRLLQGSIWGWMAGTLAALFFFWIKSAWRYAFLSLPIVFPLAYCIGFTFFG